MRLFRTPSRFNEVHVVSLLSTKQYCKRLRRTKNMLACSCGCEYCTQGTPHVCCPGFDGWHGFHQEISCMKCFRRFRALIMCMQFFSHVVTPRLAAFKAVVGNYSVLACSCWAGYYRRAKPHVCWAWLDKWHRLVQSNTCRRLSQTILNFGKRRVGFLLCDQRMRNSILRDCKTQRYTCMFVLL